MTQSHDHNHGHTHEHVPHELEQGQGGILFFDAFSGVSGDMIVSSLLDLGVPFDVLTEAIACLPINSGFTFERGTRVRNGIVASSFDVHVEGAQPERHWHEIDEMIRQAALPEAVTARARAIFRKLAEAEASIHGVSMRDVHFHEVGAVDAIVDIVGASALVSCIAPERIVCSPLPIGHGTIQARHGILPLPAPATVACLKGVPTYGVDLEGELVTPTGAAIVSTLADEFSRWPSMVVERTGFGSGAMEWSGRPNLLRVVLGAPWSHGVAEAPGTHTVIEANVDDMTGELVGHAIRELMRAGALDVWVTTTTTKKGRPGMVISALAGKSAAALLEQEMIRHTSTLGVRRYDVTRFEMPRRVLDVQTRFGVIPVKVMEFGQAQGARRAKPEFDACVRAAEQHGVSISDVMVEVVKCWGG